MEIGVSWVVDLDIRSWCDEVDLQQLRDFQSQGVGDGASRRA